MKRNTQVSPLHYIKRKDITNYFINVAECVERKDQLHSFFLRCRFYSVNNLE